MNKEIKQLSSTTFAGRRFTRKQLGEIQTTVQTFSHLSLRELAHTLCELFNWKTPTGNNRIHSCLNALVEMQDAGIVSLPEKAKQGIKKQKSVKWSELSNAPLPLTGSLDQFEPISVEKVTEESQVKLWNEFIDRYHYLGYRRPIGIHLRYFIVSKAHTEKAQVLGCLIYSFPVRSVACRDQWIGWNKAQQKKRLHLVLNNNRFLIFPWVKIRNLASKALSTSIKQVANDWLNVHGFRPALLETFVDPEKYTGASYLAANWQMIGLTAGSRNASQKKVLVYPLQSDFREQLINGKTSRKTNPSTRRPKPTPAPGTLDGNDPLILLWQKITDIVFNIAQEFDQQWQQRRRIINTMLLILFIFRLVFAKNKQGYGTTIVELWSQCRVMGIPLPQEKPVAASAMSNARKKLDEKIFKVLNQQIIRAYESRLGDLRWKGHRVFAVDGTKINLPRQLLGKLYSTPCDKAYYPQGLVSCLYQLKSKIPVDFELCKHLNERTAALSHLKNCQPKDIIIYDRGYFSYPMLYQHYKAGVNVVFRLPKNSFSVIDQFFDSDETDHIITIEVLPGRRNSILKKYPDIAIMPLKLRLIKYTVDHTEYVLGTTLFDQTYYKKEIFPDLYHARWGIEELYKVSKVLIDVEDFHAQTNRGIKQELYAHFVLITLNQIFVQHTEDVINQNHKEIENKHIFTNKTNFKVNLKNSLNTLARNIEQLFFQQVKLVTKTINQMLEDLSFCRQKKRPGRKHARTSRKPINKWKPVDYSSKKKIA